MKQTTIGIFSAREQAEQAVNRVHADLNIPADDISFLYRTSDGQLREIDATVDRPQAPSMSASVSNGAFLGLILGAMVGLAGAMNAAPIVTDLFNGPLQGMMTLASTLGITGSAALIGTAAILGAIIGSLIALAYHFIVYGMNAPERIASVDDRDRASEILVAVTAPERMNVLSILRGLGAMDARIYRLSI